ncbi:MAG: F420-0--gamma-glutamyl ligase [Acidimicrobiales bacterium]|nr:MAG: F420-0--gamma-glutamyl ligase [Acidimicrobiales bacterium]
MTSESATEGELRVVPVRGIPDIAPGDDLCAILADALADIVEDGDVLVVTQKVVSKAEGRVVSVDPDDREALRRLVYAEAKRVLRRRGELTITETRHGFVCANAGIDASNMEPGKVALLPEDPDRSARRIRDHLRSRLGVELAVIVSDTFGRPWRRGLVDVALGCAGLRPLLDLRGTQDAFGTTLRVTEVAVADEIAAAAELVMGKSDRVPAALVRGVPRRWFGTGSVQRDLLRHPSEDLFR